MAKKHKCIECVHHGCWAIPNSVSEQNYEYAKHCLGVIEHSFVCSEKNMSRPIGCELYCNKFKRTADYGMTVEQTEAIRLKDIERLRGMIATYERNHDVD